MQTLGNTRPHRSSGPWIFRLIYIIFIVIGFTYWLSLHNESENLGRQLEKISRTPIVVGKTQIGDNMVVIPTKDYFAPGQMWSLASRKHPLMDTFAVSDLTNVPVATGGDEKLQVSKKIVKPLEALFDAAESAGHELMVSSAYRSIHDQQATYDSYVKKYGETMAKEYVLPPGTSEHHTGLAVDLSNASVPCQEASDDCSLGLDSAAWLKENAPRYGFVLRYPDGKKDITGVKYEWWHFRYVGVPLAKAVATSDLTLDEAIEQMETVSARE